MAIAQSRRWDWTRIVALALVAAGLAPPASSDSVNSPNITLNVDTNRAAGSGNGAGNVSVVVGTITIAEISLPEFAVGNNRQITLAVRPGYQFDSTSNVTVQSATIGFNSLALNALASITPTGAANEQLVFELTSAAANSAAVQDIIRVNGVRIRILNAIGAAGPAQTTMSVTTSTAGGAFTDQGIVAANIQRGAPDHLVFGVQPGDTQAAGDLLPAVRIVDFGGNPIPIDRAITLALEANPGSATLEGAAQRSTSAGVATWADSDDLRITTAATGYTLRATHDGAAFLTSDTVDSAPFNILAGPAGSLEISTQPIDTIAGNDILVSVSARDEFGNLTATPVDVTLDAAVNPLGWPLLVDSSLTKATVNGVATWDAADNLRIHRAVAGYRLAASGVGAPVFTNAFDITAGPPAALRFVQQPSDVVQGSSLSPAVSVEVIDAFANRAVSTANVQLALAGAACGGSASGNVVAAANGLAEFADLKLDTPCDNVTLQASSIGLIGTTSSDFDISTGPQIASAIQFSRQPVDTAAGSDLLVDVTVLDQFGRPFTTASVGVTLSLSSNPTGADLFAISTLTKQTNAGVASWSSSDDLRITKAGSGYAFTAVGVGAPVTSSAFAVTGAAPAAARFVQQPTDVTVGEAIAPRVTVEVLDAFSNPVVNGTAIGLQLINTCGAQLSNGAASTSNGVAAFGNLVIDEDCEDVTLRTAVSGIAPVTSAVFDVNEPEDDTPPPACGACGAGSPFAFAPALLMMLPRGRRWLRGSSQQRA